MNHISTPWRLLIFNRKSVALLLLAVMLSAPLVGKVKTFASKKHDVTSYKTYEWLPPRVMTRFGLLEDDELLAPAIRQAVDRELARKGYVRVDEGGDLQVASGGFGRTSSQLEGFLVQWNFDYYWGAWTATATPVNRKNREGTLAIVLVDARDQTGVWGGLATALIGDPTLAGNTLDKSLAKRIDKAAQDIFKKLPGRKE